MQRNKNNNENINNRNVFVTLIRRDVRDLLKDLRRGRPRERHFILLV